MLRTSFKNMFAHRRRLAPNRCSIAHAVWYEPISSVRCTLTAEMPSLPEANIQQTVNHTVKGVRVLSKTVPAVTDVFAPKAAHLNRRSPSRQPPAWPQRSQTKPCGQRSHSR